MVYMLFTLWLPKNFFTRIFKKLSMIFLQWNDGNKPKNYKNMRSSQALSCWESIYRALYDIA